MFLTVLKINGNKINNWIFDFFKSSLLNQLKKKRVQIKFLVINQLIELPYSIKFCPGGKILAFVLQNYFIGPCKISLTFF